MNQLDQNLVNVSSHQVNYVRAVSYYEGMLQICGAELNAANVSESIRILQILKYYSYEPDHDVYMQLIAEHEHLLISLAANEIVQPELSLDLLQRSVELFHVFAFDEDNDVLDVHKSLEEIRSIRFCHALWHCVGSLNQAFLDVREGVYPYYQQVHRQLCNGITLARQLHYQVGLMSLIDVERKMRLCKYQRQAVNSDMMAALYDVFIALLSPFKDQLIIESELGSESSVLLTALGQFHQSLQQQ